MSLAAAGQAKRGKARQTFDKPAPAPEPEIVPDPEPAPQPEPERAPTSSSANRVGKAKRVDPEAERLLAEARAEAEAARAERESRAARVELNADQRRELRNLRQATRRARLGRIDVEVSAEDLERFRALAEVHGSQPAAMTYLLGLAEQVDGS